jgi:hypothetical protein
LCPEPDEVASAALGEALPEGVEVGLITEPECVLSLHDVLRCFVLEDS